MDYNPQTDPTLQHLPLGATYNYRFSLAEHFLLTIHQLRIHPTTQMLHLLIKLSTRYIPT